MSSRLTNHLAMLAAAVLAQAPSAACPDASNPAENKVAPESEKTIRPVAKKPIVKKLPDPSGNLYQIGLITFNKATREIQIPSTIHHDLEETLIEYLLCHLNGEKIHESLLVTKADPIHVNLAFKLLSYKESLEIFRKPKADGTPGDTYHEVDEATSKAAQFTLHVRYKDQGKEKTRPVTDWLQHRVTKKPMPVTPWVYNGSYIHQSKFKAKLNGSIFTVFPDGSAIANYSGKDREDDTLWYPAKRIPKVGTSVTLIVKPVK